jgi:hypothetical protein
MKVELNHIEKESTKYEDYKNRNKNKIALTNEQ